MKNKLEELHTNLELKLNTKLAEEGKLLYLTKVGSQLYGTNNPNSDTDYRGIYLPYQYKLLVKTDKEHIDLSKGNGNNLKNTSEDVDFDLWSLHKFLDLLSKGDTGAFDLLYSMFRCDTQLYYDDSLEVIRRNAWRFVTKNTKAFTGYCVAQAAKYGVKGTRYKELMKFYNKDMFPNDTEPDYKIGEYFDTWDLSTFEHIEFLELDATGTNHRKKLRYISVLGKKFSETIPVSEFVDRLSVLEKKYGSRSKASMEGTDWKALSHAVRVLSQVEELMEDGEMSFPLRELDLVKGIKEEHLTKKECTDIVESKLARIDYLVSISNLPSQVSKDVVYDLIMEFYGE